MLTIEPQKKHIVFLKSYLPAVIIIKDYMDKFGRMPNLIRPKTFNEKTIRKKLFDRDPRLILFTDKVRVRDFVKLRLTDGEQYLAKLYAVVDGPFKIRDLDLPDQFVMKANHLSGEVRIVHNLQECDAEELEKRAELWLGLNYYYATCEWAYKTIQPRIMFEELLLSGNNVPDDYKFYCFNGKPKYFQVDKSRFTGHRRNYYDINLNLLPVKLAVDHFDEEFVPPPNFDKMIEIAEKLSDGTDFLRVDLYNIDGRIVFGELTNYSSSGLERFVPETWDEKFGSYWR